MRQAEKFDEMRLKRKSIWGWLSVYRCDKEERTKEENEKRI